MERVYVENLARALRLSGEKRWLFERWRRDWRGRLELWLAYRDEHGRLPPGVSEGDLAQLRLVYGEVCFDLLLDRVARRFLEKRLAPWQ